MSRAINVPEAGLKLARLVSATCQRMRASGTGVESAASATAVKTRVALSGIGSGSATGFGVTTSVWGSRCTRRPVRRSCPKASTPISVRPGFRAVTMPSGPTTATLVSAERHSMVPASVRLPCDGTATRRVSASSGPRTSLPPSRAISAASTSTGTVAMRPVAVVACTMLLPGATPITTPAVSTPATSGLSDFQITLPTGAVVPSSRSPCGVRRAVSPGRSIAVAGSSVRTVPTEAPPFGPVPPVMSTARDARFPCTRASTLANPGATPWTVPSRDTRAMAVSELQKVNLAEAMRLPCRS